MIGSKEISRLEQAFYLVISVRSVGTKKGIDSLELFYGGFLLKERVDREAGFTVIELRQKQRALVRSDDDRGGGMIEMKQRMDVLTSGQDLLDISDVQQLARFEMHLADVAKRIYVFVQFEFVPAMDRRPVQDLE